MEMDSLQGHVHTRYFVTVVQTYNDLIRLDNFLNNYKGRHFEAKQARSLKYWSGRRDDYERKVSSGVWQSNVPVLECTAREFFEHINYDFKQGCFI